MDPHELMDQVAFVFQTNQLFRQTLADNVRASKPTATDDEVRAALSAAQCDDIVAKLPQVSIPCSVPAEHIFRAARCSA